MIEYRSTFAAIDVAMEKRILPDNLIKSQTDDHCRAALQYLLGPKFARYPASHESDLTQVKHQDKIFYRDLLNAYMKRADMNVSCLRGINLTSKNATKNALDWLRVKNANHLDTDVPMLAFEFILGNEAMIIDRAERARKDKQSNRDENPGLDPKTVSYKVADNAKFAIHLGGVLKRYFKIHIDLIGSILDEPGKLLFHDALAMIGDKSKEDQ